FFREPIARTLSDYQYQTRVMGVKQPFEQWISQEQHRNFQTSRLAQDGTFETARQTLEQHFTFVGITEKFNESLVMMKDKLSSIDLFIPYYKKNVASDRSIQNEIVQDKRLMESAKNANQVDIELYDYVCKELYERQRREYGITLARDTEYFTDSLPHSFTKRRYNSYVAKRNMVYKPILYLTGRYDRRKRARTVTIERITELLSPRGMGR
ncbi:MAG: hypothetical protein GY807_05860, partial [Gammaproteobacteria bacterium]|nr:hypothetical protein [Gammaproteobacteria bacterium]